jgi:hypothetical protein
MNNDTTSSDPWQSFEQRMEQDSFAVISYNAAFIVFLILGMTTLLMCVCALRRQSKQRQDGWKCAQILSFLCTTSFFGMLATGFFLIAVYAQDNRVMQQQQDDDYTGNGIVRIIDTRLDNTTMNGNEYIVAQARIIFGGNWACHNKNDTVCDTWGTITDCSTQVCRGNCTRSQRKEAKGNATECLAGIVRDYTLPIDNATIDVSVSPELDSNYPNFPFIGTST